jgi:hypothetical protein
MNEKIKELALLSFNETRNLDLDLLRFSEHFAELIIRECSVFLKDTLDDHFAAEQLVEHFGVKE